LSTEFRTEKRPGRRNKVYPTMTQGKQIPDYLRSIDPSTQEYAEIVSRLSPSQVERFSTFGGAGRASSGLRQREKFRMIDLGLPKIQHYDEWQKYHSNLTLDEARHQGIAGYNGWWNWDTWETKLILDNSERSQNQLEYLRRRWKDLMSRGQFDKMEAKFYVWKYLVPAAQGRGPFKYITEQGGQDPEIDPTQINYDEIVDSILEE